MDTRHLGKASALPASPEEAVLDYVANPRPGALYLVRFAAPEFTSLCPVTGQPDFAHLVIDYAPGETIVESKWLKLFLVVLPQPWRLPRGCDGRHRPAAGRRNEAAMAPHRRLLVSARRHSDRRLLAVGPAARRAMAARPGRAAVSRARLAEGSSSRFVELLGRRGARRLLFRPQIECADQQREQQNPQRHGQAEILDDGERSVAAGRGDDRRRRRRRTGFRRRSGRWPASTPIRFANSGLPARFAQRS